MRVLLVKLSSMGDVLHSLPVVSDLARAFPDIEIDWVTEAPYASLVALHPKVRRAISTHLRDLKKRWWSPTAWSAFLETKSQLGTNKYDVILDTQGLIKSAYIARCAKGQIAGYARGSARERSAALFYDRHVVVPRNLHAVERNRRLAAGIFGYALTNAVDYGLRPPIIATHPVSAQPYVVLLHATSRTDKMWPESRWIDLGRRFYENGVGVVLPWGNTIERGASERLAAAIPTAIVPAAMSLIDAAGLISRSIGVVGVDTGLTHLAVALARPSVGLYLTTSPTLTGLYGSNLAINLGGGSQQQPLVPGVDETWDAFHAMLLRPRH